MVVTISIISYGFESSFSSTIIENDDVPADTLPVRCFTALVATIPVPASPSGGQSGMPAFRCPDGSRLRMTKMQMMKTKRPTKMTTKTTTNRLSD